MKKISGTILLITAWCFIANAQEKMNPTQAAELRISNYAEELSINTQQGPAFEAIIHGTANQLTPHLSSAYELLNAIKLAFQEERISMREVLDQQQFRQYEIGQQQKLMAMKEMFGLGVLSNDPEIQKAQQPTTNR